MDLGVCCALASDLGASCEGIACDWKLWSCLAISRSCCEGSRFRTAGMLAGGADEEAVAEDFGAWSAAKDMVVGSMRLSGCYSRMEERKRGEDERRESKGRVDKRSDPGNRTGGGKSV